MIATITLEGFRAKVSSEFTWEDLEESKTPRSDILDWFEGLLDATHIHDMDDDPEKGGDAH